MAPDRGWRGRTMGPMAPSYHRLGRLPPKRHMAFRGPDGELYPEELVGSEGFGGRYSLLHHRYAPTRVFEVRETDPVPPSPSPAGHGALRHHLLRTRHQGPTDRHRTGSVLLCTDSHTSFMANAGVGVVWPFSSWGRLVADARYRYVDNANNSRTQNRQSMNDWLFSVGLQIPFGPPPQHSA